MIIFKMRIRLQIIPSSKVIYTRTVCFFKDHEYLAYIYQDLKPKIDICKHSTKQVLSSISKDGNVVMDAKYRRC